MLKYIFLFFFSYRLLIQCLLIDLPDLSVQNVDKKDIVRKRLDTVENCRKFNFEQKEKINMELMDPIDIQSLNNNYYDKTRAKREVEAVKYGNPALENEDIRRIENIVETFYDDENGKPAVYRQKKLPDVAVDKSLVHQNKSGRRFDFAPKILEGSHKKMTRPFNTGVSFQQIPWPKQWRHGIVPYYINSHTYDSHLQEIITKAFDYFEKNTCIKLQRLRERPTDKKSMSDVEWVYISNTNGIRQCVHSNEKKVNKGVQIVVFGYDCMSRGEILHEMMHVLGFSHEHTRPDRDHYVNIMWDNVKPGYKKYFQVRQTDALMNLKYDYESLLHYPARAFSKNGKVTIVVQNQKKIGQRDYLSETDIEKILMIFGSECGERDKQYLLTTCPSVVKAKDPPPRNVTTKSINSYFEDRIWPYATVNYKLRDALDFSTEEKENIKAVIRHIEKETCIEFHDTSEDDQEQEEEGTEEPDISEENNNSTQNINSNQLTNFTDLTAGNKVAEEEQTNNQNLESIEDESPRIIDSENFARSYKSKLKKIDTNVNLNISQNDGNTASVLVTSKPGLEQKEKQNEKGASGSNVNRRKRDVGQNVHNVGRRHSNDMVVFVRSSKPGCQCPPTGRPNGVKTVEINSDCFNSVNDLLHLFVHVLGLDHQHNMHDRDSFLHVVWDKLSPEVKEEMQNKLPPEASVGFPYDYQSVMHYPWLEIKNGVTNIMYPIWNDGWAMGHWQGLSSTDVQKLNQLYIPQCSLRKRQAS